MRIKIFLFVAIIVIAALLRFWQLGAIPVSLDWDEAAWGYNAYSIGLDGRDEFGRFLPLDYLESFGDYKPPVYAYLDVLPIKVFGLTAFGARFPSALLGTFAVAMTFLLVREVFWKSEKKDWYGLAASGILALSPWHIMLSRAAFEANVAEFFILTGGWLFLLYIRKKHWYLLLLSVISFIISVYTFNSARVVAPVLLILLCLFSIKTLWQRKIDVLVAFVIGVLLLIPFLHFLGTPQSKLRYDEVSIFSDVSLIKTANQEVANDHNAWWSKILHNRRAVYTVAYIQHYFDNLAPSFLFIKGDGNPRFSTQDIGEMYLWDLPFFVIGIFLLFKKKEGYWWLIPIWLLIGIVPAAVAEQTPHALRIENSLPMFQILTAYGFIEACFFFKKRRKLFVSLSLIILALFVLYFQHGYYTHYTQEYSDQWQDGYQAAYAYAQTYQNNYKHIVVTQALGRPYIYMLFFDHISPTTFRKTSIVKRDVFGFVTVTQVGKYLFPTSIPTLSHTLYIVTPDEVPGNVKIKASFPLANGKPALVAYER